jgi:hypothetical protein
MIRQKLRLLIPALAGILAATLAASCSSEESPTPSGPGGAGGTGGSAGSGGRGGAGGTAGTGGGADAGDVYTCYATQNKNPDPGGMAASGASCCHGVGTCTARSAVAASIVASLGKSDCAPSGDLLCAPKDPAQIQGLPNGMIPKCTGTYGSLTLEGRCLPRCLTLGNKAAASLDAGDCPASLATALNIPATEVICAPCFNPIDGMPTGACSQYGDAPTTTAPAPFTACGGFDGGAPLGLCVPQALVENVAQDTTLIPPDTCPSGQLCAPKNKIQDPNSCFAKCAAAVGGDGVCVATYIVEGPNSPGKGFSGILGQGTPPCPLGETCTPCINPLADSSTPTPTGACRF